MADERYEDRFSGAGRRIARLQRALRWRLKSDPRNILVELRWRLGDEIMALPVLAALKSRYPGCRIHVLTAFPDLFLDNPHISAVNTIPEPVDHYIFLRHGPRTEFRPEVYARAAGVETPEDRPRLSYADWLTPLLNELPEGSGPLVMLSTGASWPSKRWPVARWRELRDALIEEGVRLAELGHDDEAIGGMPSFMNRSTIREAACLLHHADLFIGCDSGLMHLALAAETPAVALFGPTDPAILIRNDNRFHPVRSRLKCSGFWNRREGDDKPGRCPEGHESCLHDITVDQVIGVVRPLLHGG